MRRVGQHAKTVPGVARQLGGGWHTVLRAVRDYGQPLVKEAARLAAVTAFGVDEQVWSHARPRRATGFATGIVDFSPGWPPQLPATTTGASRCRWRRSTRSTGCQGACAAAASQVVTVPPGGVALALRSAGPSGVPA